VVPPVALVPDEAPPPLDALPPAAAEVVDAVVLVVGTVVGLDGSVAFVPTVSGGASSVSADGEEPLPPQALRLMALARPSARAAISRRECARRGTRARRR
jgi:hypothetical protein